MAFKGSSLVVMMAILLSLLMCLMYGSGEADARPIEIICVIDSVQTALENDSIRIPVTLTNFEDTVFGVELWVNIANPELVQWIIDSTWWVLDSTCLDPPECNNWDIDSVSEISSTVIDTVGYLVGGWESFGVHVLGGPSVLKIVGLADQTGGPMVRGIPPGTTDTLFVMIARTNGSLDTSFALWHVDSICIDSIGPGQCIEWAYDSTFICDTFSNIGIHFNQGQTHFSNPHGDMIPCYDTTVIDSLKLGCIEWDHDTCIAWEWDIDTFDICWPDPSQIILSDGKVTLNCSPCDWIVGDADYNGIVEISDPVYLIAYIFIPGSPAPVPVEQSGDADCSGIVEISDAVYLIAYIFIPGSPPPPCECGDLI